MDVGSFFGASMGLMVLFWIAEIALVVYALIDLFQRGLDTPMKILWLLVILFAPIIGSLIYLLVGRSMRGTAV